MLLIKVEVVSLIAQLQDNKGDVGGNNVQAVITQQQRTKKKKGGDY